MSNPTTKEHEFFIDQIMQFTFEFTFLRNKFFWGVLLAEHVKKIEHPHDCVRVVRWLHCLMIIEKKNNDKNIFLNSKIRKEIFHFIVVGGTLRNLRMRFQRLRRLSLLSMAGSTYV